MLVGLLFDPFLRSFLVDDVSVGLEVSRLVLGEGADIALEVDDDAPLAVLLCGCSELVHAADEPLQGALLVDAVLVAAAIRYRVCHWSRLVNGCLLLYLLKLSGSSEAQEQRTVK